MVNARSNFREYYRGVLFVSGDNVRNFKYAIAEEQTKRLNKPTRNLMSESNSMTIKTSWDLPFKPNMTVDLSDVRYKILKCQKLKTELNEAANRMWRPNNVYWVIEVER